MEGMGGMEGGVCLFMCVFEHGALEFVRKEKGADMAVSNFESSLLYRRPDQVSFILDKHFHSRQAFSLQTNSGHESLRREMKRGK